MPTIPTVNTQQVLQMSGHAEKLQQTQQHQPTLVASQLMEEKKLADELKRSEIQDFEEASFVVQIKSQKNPGQAVSPKNNPDSEEEPTSPAKSPASKQQKLLGSRIDLMV
jgi:hypothetical protein